MSTIITDNPYTFTVEDNMSINAVFENANVIVNDIRQGVSVSAYSSESWYLKYGTTILATWNLGTSGSSVSKNGTYPRTLTDTSKKLKLELKSGSGVFSTRFRVVDTSTSTILIDKTTETSIDSILGKTVNIVFNLA